MKNFSNLSSSVSAHSSFRLQYQLISALILMLVVTILGVIFIYSMNEHVRSEAASKNVHVVEQFSKNLKQSTLHRLNSLDEVVGVDRQKIIIALSIKFRLALSFTKSHPKTKFKIYNLNGVLVYSQTSYGVGDYSGYEKEFKRARNGESVSRLSNTNSTVLISWEPIYKNKSVLGVAEVYQDIESGLAEVNRQQNRVIWALFLTAFFLHLVFSVYISKLDKSVKEHKKYSTLQEQQQEYLIYHDKLTGLPNRELFIDRLVHAAAKVDRAKEKLAVMFIDVDRFKLINDGLGYNAGNEIVKMVAERLQTAVREYDTIARVGGDEFTVLLEKVTDPQEAVYVVNRIQKSLSGTFIYHGQEINLTASIGISIYPEDEGKVEELINHADTAKDKAKKHGGGDYRFYTCDMNKYSWDRMEMERDLRHGLDKNQYILHFQPKVDLTQGRITGMEALLRWQRTEDHMVSPVDFIPMLEETGLIIDVGEWVLRESCKIAKLWDDQGFGPMVMAVNVSSRQFRQLDFVDMVYSILEETGLPARQLEIEVTEGVLMEDTQASLSTLEALKSHGIRIAIDDFGTGYSSLSYLQRYPIDTLKIDRAFVQDIDSNSEGVAITTTIIALAHNLRLHIVAEGVETNKQLEFLTALGCQDIQGFLFSKPLEYKDFCELLEKESEMFERVFSQKRNSA